MRVLPVGLELLSACAEVRIAAYKTKFSYYDGEPTGELARLTEISEAAGFYGLLIEEEGQPVAFALGNTEDWDGGLHFYLQDLCVAPSRQRCGLGSELLRALEAELTSRDFASLFLFESRYDSARVFCEKRGFILTEPNNSQCPAEYVEYFRTKYHIVRALKIVMMSKHLK